MRNLVTTLAAASLLAGCATAPELAHEGDLSPLKGKILVAQASQAGPPAGSADATLTKAVEGQLLTRLAARGADTSSGKAPAYLMQVAIGTSVQPVGISTATGSKVATSPWRSAPTKPHWWTRRGPARTTTLVILDTATGKPAAWATVRGSSADPAVLADQLMKALAPVAKG